MLLTKNSIFACLVALTCCGCINSLISHSNLLVSRLSNRGPLALSSENPYIATNLFLAREVEKSSELKGLLEVKGTPAAIEIITEILQPLKLQLYYPNNNNFYTLESIAQNLWFISGPFNMSVKQLAQIKDLSIGQGQQAAFVSYAAAASTKAIDVSGSKPQQHGVLDKPKSPREVLAVLDRLQLAEISPKGDLVHYVTSDKETIEAIAAWYTLDDTNATRVKRINNLQSDLTAGDVVVIPQYLLKNKYLLPGEYLAEIQNWASN